MLHRGSKAQGAPLVPCLLSRRLAKGRDQLGRDWEAIAAAIYRTLGKRSEIKGIVVERLIHRLRWWIKSLIWFDDKRDRFLLDVYAGDIRGDEERWGAYGNPPYGDP